MSISANIQAIIFDIDGVLLDSWAANCAYYRDLLHRHGYPPVDDATLAYCHSHTMRESLAHLTGAPDDEVAALFEQARNLAGYPYELATLPEGCVEVLDALSRDYALAIMSSRIAEGIQQYLDLSSLHHRFSATVGYDDCARAKPHPDPLLLACERLGVAPRASVYVGDAPGDMACAEAAGAGFIAYGNLIPDAPVRINRFAELPGALERLSA